MKTAPIGVFDSGLGGLTAVRELRKILPNEDIIYFGDTARVPYGSRGRDILVDYSEQDIAFLLSQDVKIIVIACGTVSSILPVEVRESLPVKCIEVVSPTVQEAARQTQNKKVGVIGTQATIQSDSYVEAMRKIAPKVTCFSTPCPLFVPLVENGYFLPGNAVAELVAKDYLTEIKEAGVDTLIMGCTHYPLLASVISLEMGPNVKLVDAGRQAAHSAKEYLEKQQLLTDQKKEGSVQYFVSDVPDKFHELSSVFLGEYAGGSVKKINIEEYSL